MTDEEREQRIRDVELRLCCAVIGRAAADAPRDKRLSYKLAAELVHLEERVDRAAELARRLEGLDLSPIRDDEHISASLNRTFAVARALMEWAQPRRPASGRLWPTPP